VEQQAAPKQSLTRNLGGDPPHLGNLGRPVCRYGETAHDRAAAFDVKSV
jgi:hypothetical protein